MTNPRPEDRVALVDALAYLGVWPAGVAAALALVSGLALGRELAEPALLRLMAFAFCGTTVVYDVDRLRDLERDRGSAPRRARFVAARRTVMLGVIAVCGVASAMLAARLSAGAWLLCAGALALGLLHRRLKTRRNARVAYVTGAWLAVVVGLPAQAWLAETGSAGAGVRAIALLGVAQGSAIAANLVCSGIRVWPGGGIPAAERGRLVFARGLAGVGAAATLALGGGLWPLAALPASQALAALRFRSDERFRHAQLDAELLAGAILAAGLLTFTR